LKGFFVVWKKKFDLIFFSMIASIHDAFRSIKNEICNQFQSIRQQHDSILLTKQMDVLKTLEFHEQTLLT
jgi:hypothetical protein